MINNTTDIYSYDCIPSRMKALPQWGSWKLVVKKDKHHNVILDENGDPKKDKLPIDAKTGEIGNSTDPTTWTTFEKALEYVERNNPGNLAFFTKEPANESGFWIYGVDLDDSIDPNTGQFRDWPGAPIQPKEIADRLNSVTGFTPSGAGIRIYVISREALPPGCSANFGLRNPATGKKPGVEIYGRDRFFTVLPAFLGEYSMELEDRTEELLEIHKIIFGNGRSTKNPCAPFVEEPKRLERATVTGINPEESEFVTAIANHRTATGTRHDVLLGVGGWLVGAGWPRERILAVLAGLVGEFQRQDPNLNADDKLPRAIKHLDETIGRYRSGKCIAGVSHLKKHVDPAVIERFQFREACTPTIPKKYRLTENGVYYYPPKDRDDAEAPPPVWLCGRLEVRARTRTVDGDDWGLYLVWVDAEDREHTWTMACELLATDGSPILQELRRCGLNIAYGKGIRELLLAYIAGCRPSMIITSVNRTGWNGDSYVLPDESIGGTDSESAVVQANGIHHFKVKGTVEDWIKNVGALCKGNSRLVFGTSVSFAGPLLDVTDTEGGGVHALGTTSSGKTTMLCCAASVWGRREFVRSWRATSNGMEGIAALHNDSVLILDEIGQADPSDVGEGVYMLANGIGKARMNRSGTIRMPTQFRLLFISAGEKRLREHMGSAGKKIKGGQEVRLLEFGSDAGAGLGAFEELHGSSSGGEFADRLKRNAAEYYGAVGRGYLEYLVNHRQAVKQDILAQIAVFSAANNIPGASSEVYRALQRFALIGVAGELATKVGLTGWEPRESLNAAAKCFKSWINLRGTKGGSDVESGIRQVRLFLERHGSTRFQNLDVQGITLVNNRAGCKETFSDLQTGARVEEDPPHQYYIFDEVFRDEVCAGFDASAIARELKKRNQLFVKEEGRYTYKKTIPGLGRVRVYHILPSLFEEVDTDGAMDTAAEESQALGQVG